MIIPLTNTPTILDLPRPRAQLPQRFCAFGPDGRELYCASCPMCDVPVKLSREEYNAGVEAICTECEATAAELRW